MNFSFELPTVVRFGRGAVRENAKLLALGKRAFVVTGANSGRKSGALGDVLCALSAEGVAYEVYEGIGSNPNVSACRTLGQRARAFGADFIVGIGGGSPLDAAKAIAVFAANEIDEQRLFQYGYENGVLPIAAIPTTSGTGSEVTPWSIMTDDTAKTKRSFGGTLTFPRVALLDPTYTEKLPRAITFDTGMDAFQHCFESFLSMRATPATDALCLEALKRFSHCMQPLAEGKLEGIREELMLISMLGGMAIAQTGTTLMHAMGYPLTYFHDVPHGRANSLVLPAYVAALDAYRPERLREALNALGVSKDKLCDFARMHTDDCTLHPDEAALQFYAEQTSRKDPMATTGVPGDAASIYRLYRIVFPD